MQFFSSNKCLQEIFFQNHPPPLSRVKWSAPKFKVLRRRQRSKRRLIFNNKSIHILSNFFAIITSRLQCEMSIANKSENSETPIKQCANDKFKESFWKETRWMCRFNDSRATYAILIAHDENRVVRDAILVAQETRRDW